MIRSAVGAKLRCFPDCVVSDRIRRKKLSGAQRRMRAARGERGAGKEAKPLFRLSTQVARSATSGLAGNAQPSAGPVIHRLFAVSGQDRVQRILVRDLPLEVPTLQESLIDPLEQVFERSIVAGFNCRQGKDNSSSMPDWWGAHMDTNGGVGPNLSGGALINSGFAFTSCGYANTTCGGTVRYDYSTTSFVNVADYNISKMVNGLVCTRVQADGTANRTLFITAAGQNGPWIKLQ
jgi:hypothetical protein